MANKTDPYKSCPLSDLELIDIKLNPDGWVEAEWFICGETDGRFFPKKMIMGWILDHIKNSTSSS